MILIRLYQLNLINFSQKVNDFEMGILILTCFEKIWLWIENKILQLGTVPFIGNTYIKKKKNTYSNIWPLGLKKNNDR